LLDERPLTASPAGPRPAWVCRSPPTTKRDISPAAGACESPTLSLCETLIRCASSVMFAGRGLVSEIIARTLKLRALPARSAGQRRAYVWRRQAPERISCIILPIPLAHGTLRLPDL